MNTLMLQKIIPFAIIPVCSFAGILEDNSYGVLDAPQTPTAAMLSAGEPYSPDVTATERLIHTPGFTWYHGGANAAVGTYLKFYDTHGFSNLFPSQSFEIESSDWSILASDAHYRDYCVPLDTDYSTPIPDKGYGAHLPNCIADFTYSSYSFWECTYGETLSENVITGAYTYLLIQYPFRFTTLDLLNFWELDVMVTPSSATVAWNDLKQLIDSNNPAIALVNLDTDDNKLDHAVCIIGYREKGNKRYYIAYNGWSTTPYVYEFKSAYATNSNYISNTVNPDLFSVGILNGVYLNEVGRLWNPVYMFYRFNNASFFFTANEAERDSLSYLGSVFELQNIDHFVYTGAHTSTAVPVYRFLNRYGAHFYTASEEEKNAVIANLSHVYTLEGIAYYVESAQVEGALPVYRFFQAATASHFFTISERLKDEMVANKPQFQFEGVAYYAFPSY